MNKLLRKIKSVFALLHKRSNVIKKEISGSNNRISIGEKSKSGTLHIRIKGNNNKVTIGKKCTFFGENWIYIKGDNNTLNIGDMVIIDSDVHFVLQEGRTINVGNECMFGKHTVVRTSDQHAIFDNQGNRINFAKDVNIGDHVWLCASVFIMKGVTVGDGSVVGLSSMVTKDVPNNCIVVGQPAKVIRENIHWTRKLPKCSE